MERHRPAPLGGRRQAVTAGPGEGECHGQEAAIYVLIVDIAAVLLIAFGIALLLKRRDRAADAAPAHDDPRTYIRRIAGTMLATFGLALGLMVTLYHFSAAG